MSRRYLGSKCAESGCCVVTVGGVGLMGIAEAVWWWVGGWVEVLVTVSHWAPSGPEKTLGVSFSVKFQGGEFYVLPGPLFFRLLLSFILL